ncbi:unnamed protein product [Pleuronectes platessa]|uniref:Uncharacterized protein n=1 Tax=Pleuronectes platessa TaxID=8262 RepID=A0A9N7UUK2_PLEPL|nr:unnamed protein product [Pleuronectes platessa]
MDEERRRRAGRPGGDMYDLPALPNENMKASSALGVPPAPERLCSPAQTSTSESNLSCSRAASSSRALIRRPRPPPRCLRYKPGGHAHCPVRTYHQSPPPQPPQPHRPPAQTSDHANEPHPGCEIKLAVCVRAVVEIKHFVQEKDGDFNHSELGYMFPLLTSLSAC